MTVVMIWGWNIAALPGTHCLSLLRSVTSYSTTSDIPVTPSLTPHPPRFHCINTAFSGKLDKLVCAGTRLSFSIKSSPQISLKDQHAPSPPRLCQSAPLVLNLTEPYSHFLMTAATICPLIPVKDSQDKPELKLSLYLPCPAQATVDHAALPGHPWGVCCVNYCTFDLTLSWGKGAILLS